MSSLQKCKQTAAYSLKNVNKQLSNLLLEEEHFDYILAFCRMDKFEHFEYFLKIFLQRQVIQSTTYRNSQNLGENSALSIQKVPDPSRYY